MKKYLPLPCLLLITTILLQAGPVDVKVAKTVAINFYNSNSAYPASGLALAYTPADINGTPLLYAFNINNNSGFVIVSGDDASHPIIGYSTSGHFVTPVPGNNVDYWLTECKSNIQYVRNMNSKASAMVAAEWNLYQSSIVSHQSSGIKDKVHGRKEVMAVAPLCQTTWNQSPFYNADCPGGSVTGCVATAMAQILAYWQYPPHGLLSSFYTETSPENYGLLYANYDAATYLWSAMPDNLSSDNDEVAKLMYDCGVSVNMSYSPSESGAWVINADSKICTQNAIVTYFGYNGATIQGLKRKNYSDSAWLAMIINEINNSRPLEWAGWDTVYGGHNWVCDGYDSNNYVHMNWGWGSYDDGYYSIDTITPLPYNFFKNDELLTGIEPAPIIAAFDASLTNGCANLTVNFTDRSIIPPAGNPITTWNWQFPGGTPSASNAQNPTITYSTPGTYPVTLKVLNAINSDSVTKTSFITVNGDNALPFDEGFQESSFPPSQWTILNPWSHPVIWAQYTGAGGFGSSNKCMYFNNCSGGQTGRYDRILTPSFTFTDVPKPALFFDVAYTPYNANYSDTLMVYYSLDCGNTFTPIYTKGGMKLCTTGGITLEDGANSDFNGCFVPTSSNWRTDTITVPALANQSEVLFAFENRSGNGSNIYIDNINTSVNLAVNNIREDKSLAIEPNPNKGNFTIQWSVAGAQFTVGTTVLKIYNALGQEVLTITKENNESQESIPVNISSFAKGIYTLTFDEGQNKFVRKVVVY